MSIKPRYILNTFLNLDIAAFVLTSSYLLNVNKKKSPIYLINRHFCMKTRLWCHAIDGKYYIEQHIMCSKSKVQLNYDSL